MSCTPTRSDFRGPVARSGELPRRFAAPASRKDCRQSLTEGVRPGVGSLIGPLEPRNAEAGPARPASASCGEPQFATLHFRNVRAGRRPARSDVSEESRSNARGSCRIGAGLVSRVAPAASGPARSPPLCVRPCASSITLYAVDGATSLKILQPPLGSVIPAFDTLLAQRSPS